MKVSELLIAGKKILCETGWCQGNFAKDRRGRSVPTMSKSATCFCAMGAVNRAAFAAQPDREFSLRWKAEQYLDSIAQRDPAYMGIVSFNDSPDTTRDEVVHLFDLAIAQAEAEDR